VRLGITRPSSVEEIDVPEDQPERGAAKKVGARTNVFVVFDVIETLFSTQKAARTFEELGMPSEAFDQAFAETLRDAFALSLAGACAPFARVLERSFSEASSGRGSMRSTRRPSSGR
jgi:hypothetical protein